MIRVNRSIRFSCSRTTASWPVAGEEGAEGVGAGAGRSSRIIAAGAGGEVNAGGGAEAGVGAGGGTEADSAAGAGDAAEAGGAAGAGVGAGAGAGVSGTGSARRSADIRSLILS
ncbi:hypothetical protein ACFV4N_39790, partial [Actinosynnema sp. NPDC059797]